MTMFLPKESMKLGVDAYIVSILPPRMFSILLFFPRLEMPADNFAASPPPNAPLQHFVGFYSKARQQPAKKNI